MTYREVLKVLMCMTKEQLNSNVSILHNGEYLLCENLTVTREHDVLDRGHPLFVTR
jgi:hypothetical protein